MFSESFMLLYKTLHFPPTCPAECHHNHKIITELMPEVRSVKPFRRLDVLTSPDFYVGRGRDTSIIGIFNTKFNRSRFPEKSGRYGHPDFAKYFKYLVEGPCIPDPMQQNFKQYLDNMTGGGQITSGDFSQICAWLRNSVRNARETLDVEHVYRWMLEDERMDVSFAKMIRQDIMPIIRKREKMRG